MAAVLRIKCPGARQMQGDMSEANSAIELWDHSALDQGGSSSDGEKRACAEYILKLVPTGFADEWMLTMKEGGCEVKYQSFCPKQWIFY